MVRFVLGEYKAVIAHGLFKNCLFFVIFWYNSSWLVDY